MFTAGLIIGLLTGVGVTLVAIYMFPPPPPGRPA